MLVIIKQLNVGEVINIENTFSILEAALGYNLNDQSILFDFVYAVKK